VSVLFFYSTTMSIYKLSKRN